MNNRMKKAVKFEQKYQKPIIIGDKEKKLINKIPEFESLEIPKNAFINPDLDYFFVAKSIMRKHFELHKVPYSLKIIAQDINDLYASNLISKNDAIKNFCYLIEILDPYDIPRTYTTDIYDTGTGISEVKLNSKTTLFSYNSIRLPIGIGSLIAPVYNHEIMHTQVSDNGSIKDYKNNEILPIFIENLSLLEMDASGELFTYFRKFRLKLLRDYINTLSSSRAISPEYKQILSTFITSELKGAQLFNIYINSNSEQKQNILALIQSVIDGKMTLESILKTLDITYKNSCNADVLTRSLTLIK